MGRLLCHCMVVEEAEVRRAIRAGARTVEEVGSRCEAGTGCGSCRAVIAVVLAEETMRRASKGDNAVPAALLAQLALFRRRDDE